MKLIAVDPSLTCSGWALFNGQKLIGVGHLKSIKGLLPDRLERLWADVSSLLVSCELKTGDALVCEDATTMKDPSAAIKVEQVRGIFECSARSIQLTVPGRVNPRTVHTSVLGMKGMQLSRALVKESAAQIVGHLYGDSLKRLGFDVSIKNLTKHQDICDAILIGHVASGLVTAALQSGQSLSQHFSNQSIKGKRWTIGA